MNEPNVYDLLRDELLENTYISEEIAEEVVRFLQENGFIDYDVLKEIYLYEDNEL